MTWIPEISKIDWNKTPTINVAQGHTACKLKAYNTSDNSSSNPVGNFSDKLVFITRLIDFLTGPPWTSGVGVYPTDDELKESVQLNLGSSLGETGEVFNSGSGEFTKGTIYDILYVHIIPHADPEFHFVHFVLDASGQGVGDFGPPAVPQITVAMTGNHTGMIKESNPSFDKDKYQDRIVKETYKA